MFSFKNVLYLGTFLLFASVPLSSTLIIQPSVDLLTPRDKTIGLNCFIGQAKVNKWTTFRFTVQEKEVYNSKTNKTASGVTVLNQTSIIYSQISAGLIQAACYLNATKSSNQLTVSAFKSLTQTIVLNGGVSVATIGKPVTQKCTQVTVPNVQQYTLNFLKDNIVIGKWEINGKKGTFTIPNIVGGLQVTKGNTSAIFSSISVMPTSTKANGMYACQFVYANKYESTSSVWNGKFAPPEPTTTTTATKNPPTKAPTTKMPTMTTKHQTTPTKSQTTPTKPTTKAATTKMTTKSPATTASPTKYTTKTPTTTPTPTHHQTTETPKQTTTSKSEPTKPKTTSHDHTHSTTSKHHHHTTTQKPHTGAGTSVQVSTLTTLASVFAVIVLLFVY